MFASARLIFGIVSLINHTFSIQVLTEVYWQYYVLPFIKNGLSKTACGHWYNTIFIALK